MLFFYLSYIFWTVLYIELEILHTIPYKLPLIMERVLEGKVKCERPDGQIVLYRCGPYITYDNGPLLSHTGYITCVMRLLNIYIYIVLIARFNLFDTVYFLFIIS